MPVSGHPPHTTTACGSALISFIFPIDPLVMPRATKARVLKPPFHNRQVTSASSWGVLISIDRRFHWAFQRLRCARVAFSRLHNPRNASKTTDPPVMAGAIEARGIYPALSFLDVSSGNTCDCWRDRSMSVVSAILALSQGTMGRKVAIIEHGESESGGKPIFKA